MFLTGDFLKLSKAFSAQGQQECLADSCVVQARFTAFLLSSVGVIEPGTGCSNSCELVFE